MVRRIPSPGYQDARERQRYDHFEKGSGWGCRGVGGFDHIIADTFHDGSQRGEHHRQKQVDRSDDDGESVYKSLSGASIRPRFCRNWLMRPFYQDADPCEHHAHRVGKQGEQD